MKRATLLAEMRRALSMAAPLISAQLLQISNGLVDTLVAGRLGAVALAAGGIGASLLFIGIMVGIGLMAGLSPTMARILGQGRRHEVGAVFRQGLWLGAALGLLMLVMITLVAWSIPRWSFDAELIPAIQSYLWAARWSVLPAIVLLAARNLCEATGRNRPVLVVTGIGVVVNLFGNLGLGLGWFGLPALGLAGIGWATSLVNLVSCSVLFWLVAKPRYARYGPFERFDWPNPDRLWRLLCLSAPICLGLLFETGLFAATAVQMGLLSTLAASAHNVAIGVTAFAYMLPLGLGFALTARIGVALGREHWPGIELRVISGLLLSLGMALLSALLLLIFHRQIPVLYTSDPEVRQLASQLLLMAAVFQLSDDFQGTLFAMLRGLHDTRVPMIITAFSYWVVGFGGGYYSAHSQGLGPYGFWLGLILGLTTSASLLGWRLAHQLRQQRTTGLSVTA